MLLSISGVLDVEVDGVRGSGLVDQVVPDDMVVKNLTPRITGLGVCALSRVAGAIFTSALRLPGDGLSLLSDVAVLITRWLGRYPSGVIALLGALFKFALDLLRRHFDGIAKFKYSKGD